MEKAEVQRTARLLLDVHEGVYEGGEPVTMQQLTELYRVIELLMDETSKANDQDFKVFLVSLEYRPRKYKQAPEERLGARN